jgi:PadR family transcriptional regulator, regulatory protein PadR
MLASCASSLRALVERGAQRDRDRTVTAAVVDTKLMSIRKRSDREYSAHLQGTLDLLILRTLIFGPQHGQGIARAIQEQSDDVLIVDHGSLYPALQRLEERGFVAAEWGTSENNRKARFYTLTRTGRKELTHEEGEWRRIAAAIMRVLGPAKRNA